MEPGQPQAVEHAILIPRAYSKKVTESEQTSPLTRAAELHDGSTENHSSVENVQLAQEFTVSLASG